jgi:integrase
MQLNRTAQLHRHVIPITSNTPNRHTRAKIRIADACHDHARPIATRITLNTGSAKTRHTFASAMLARGVQITELAHFLGHRDINVTHQVYGHLLPSAAKRAVAALDAEFAEWSKS